MTCRTGILCVEWDVKTYALILINTGHKPGIVGRIPTMGCAHSKITRVRVLSWPLPLRTTLYFLRVMEVLSKFVSK